MKPKWSEHTTENIIALTVSGIIISIVWGILHNLSGVGSLLGQVWNALSPFLIGFCLAFIMLPIRKIAENKWLKNVSWKPKTKRRMATLIAMMVFILIVASFFIVLIPQMVSSIRTLVSSMDSYMESFGQFLDGITQDANAAAILTNVYDWIRNSLTSFISGADGLLAKVLNYSVSFVKGIFNFFIGLIVSAYILLDQENFQRQIKKVTYSLFSHGHADHIFDVLRLSSQMFSGFIFGKALDSLIIGVICYICCLIMRMPYSPLIAFTVGITNMIPFFGPFIGAIPCAFILLIIKPIKAVEFALFILILQQIDGNIIGPKILGGSLGLPALWVMFAIIVGGSLFGILGMFFAVPVFSVIYVLIRDQANRTLSEKNIDI